MIRRETTRDSVAIREIHLAAFARPDGVPADEAALVDRVREAGDALAALSFVALDGEQVVGHVTGSRATIGGHASVGLGPLGVRPDHQGRGVGTALVHAVLGAAEALDLPEVVLLGRPGFYRRFGFRPATELGVTPPDDAWGEHFQVRPLTRWNADRQGRFRYAPGFDVD